MKCVTCGGQTDAVKATRDNPYHFTKVGFRGVHLVGIVVETCEKCGVKYPIIPHMEQLHRVIASALVKKPNLLAGKEIRFLRLLAGFPAGEFASLLMIEPATLSRAENDIRPLGDTSDKLARAVAMAAIDEATIKSILMELADKLKKPARPKLPVFKYEHAWKVAA